MTGVSESELRGAVVAEAKTWLGTPYVSNGDVKGAGVDCGMLLVRVFVDLGLVAPFEPRPYPAQWSFHQSAERYLEIVERLASEIPGPPEPGDLALFKIGRCWAHGAIVIDWPEILHANPPGTCRYDNWEQNFSLRKRAPRFFSIWPRA